ncbi:thioredoxin family protein [Flavobacterium sp. 3HN19-14]|uniref:thioredoxin family protein n=1 Tax=Flavobacterium sp. 3HN19-14 TaxID=3448133 RepID=UPI003EE1B003
MKAVIDKALLNSHSYAEYRKIVTDLLAEGKVSGDKQSEDLVHYTLLNETRMNRLEKTLKITDEVSEKLKNLQKKYIWLVISEGWCGDAAQLLPVFEKMASVSENIDLKIVFRDANNELMDLFLTNGARSIPKLIILDKTTNEVISDFGSRPKAAFDLVKNYKEKHGVIDETIKTELQLWYLHDKGISTQNEIIGLLEN